MIEQSISNFYMPAISKRIFVKLQKVGASEDDMNEDVMEEEKLDENLPHGLMDGSLQNSPYKELRAMLGIDAMSNEKIRRSVKDKLINTFGIKIPDSNENLRRWFVDDENEKIDDSEFRTSMQAVYLWRYARYSVKSIAATLLIPKEKVHQILTNYRASARKLSKEKKRIRKGVRSSVDSQQVQSIKQYWEETTKRPIKIRDIKHYVWPISQEQKPPHNSTISRILKKELGMSFKVLQKRNPKTRQEENVRLFHEAIAIQVFLREKDFELIYIDEFSYSSKK